MCMCVCVCVCVRVCSCMCVVCVQAYKCASSISESALPFPSPLATPTWAAPPPPSLLLMLSMLFCVSGQRRVKCLHSSLLLNFPVSIPLTSALARILLLSSPSMVDGESGPGRYGPCLCDSPANELPRFLLPFNDSLSCHMYKKCFHL